MLRRTPVRVALVLAILCASPATASAAPVQLVKVGSFAEPTYVTAPRGDTHRLFVVELEGRIQVLDDGVRHQFLDLSGLVSCCAGERGLHSMAFAPDYETSGRFYVQYTAKDPVGAVTVAEYRRSAADPDVADPASGRILLTIPHNNQSNHNGGQLQIGPDGALYIGVGDGGGSGDPAGNGQNLTESSPGTVSGVNHNPLLGKLLRIDPRSGSPYAIPPGNRFPPPAAEVYAYGLRNPWRFSFDRLTGDLIIADVGQNAYEEIDFGASPGRLEGANLGWSIYEGLHTFPGGTLVTPPFPPGFTFPVAEQRHASGICSITGGYVVRDPNLPELAGQYVYADFCGSDLHATTLTSSGAQGDHALDLDVFDIASFGEDACARVYVVSLFGEVDRLSNGTPSVCTQPVPPFPGTPTVAVGDVRQTEGDAGAVPANFVVSLSGTSSDAVTVHYATNDGTAAAPGDYTSTSGNLSFAPGEISKTVDVPVQGDLIDEDDETFSLDLSAPGNATIADGHGVATITDDDPAPTVSISGGSATEGDTLSYTVTVSAPSGKTVTVGYATADGTAHEPDDYHSAGGTLTFAPGETSKRIDVSGVEDSLHELDETVAVDLSNPTNATLGAARAFGTITDDDPAPTVSIADASVTEGDTGTAELKLTATLSTASGLPASVHYATADGTATAPGDYSATSGTLNFAAGETSMTIVVTVSGDTISEGDETLKVQLSQPTGATIADGEAVGTIRDDDGLPALTVADATATEGGSAAIARAAAARLEPAAGELTFLVGLQHASVLPVSVHYATADGSAHAPADYAVTSGDLTFDPGQTLKTIVVPLVDDQLDEDDETLTLELSAPVNATLSTARATGTIQDDDAAPALSIADALAMEGDAGQVSAPFAVSLSAPSGKSISVVYATADGTAHSPGDYHATSGTVSFAPGETTAQIDVGVQGDRLYEGDETFALDLTGPVNATLARAHATGTVADDDPLPALTIVDAQLTEGDSGTTPLAFTVTTDHPSAFPIVVAFATADGTAHAPGDYTATSGTLTLGAGEQSGQIMVPVAGDVIDEDDQTLHVGLGTVTGASVARGDAIGTILDDDAPPVVSVSDASRAEGDTGTAPMTFTVSLSAPSEKVVSVGFATSDGTATGGTDFVKGSGVVSFAPGETRRSVGVDVDGDVVPELDESLRLQVAGTSARGIIRDDDPAAARIHVPQAARIASLFCRPGRRCRGIAVDAFYGAAGRGRWTFAAGNRSGRMTLGHVDVRVRARGRGRTAFRLPAGARNADRRRRLLAQRHPVLYATLTFTAVGGKRTTLRSRTELRR